MSGIRLSLGVALPVLVGVGLVMSVAKGVGDGKGIPSGTLMSWGSKTLIDEPLRKSLTGVPEVQRHITSTLAYSIII